MEKTASPKRRRLKLALAGVVWAFLLVNAPGFLLRPRPAAARLPDLSATRSPSHLDARLAQVVDTLAGREAAVLCWSHRDWKRRDAERADGANTKSLGAWAAFTRFEPGVAVELSPEICVELSRLVALGEPVWRDDSKDAAAWSLEALAHESVHVAGNLSETMATCRGMQLIPAAAVELGRSRAEGRYLAELFWKRWYRRMVPAYRSNECRNGGALDLRPGTDVWP